MSYKKVVAGVGNQSNETASNNKMVFAHSGFGYAALYAVFFVSVWITVVIVFEWIAHPDFLADAVTATFFGAIATAWLFAVGWVRRDLSNTKTLITVNDATQEKSLLEARILAMTEQYILYKDHNNEIQFRGTVTVTENRHFPAIEAPKEQDITEYVLAAFDGGSSARGIEKYVNMGKTGKDKISYHQITKILDMHRENWKTRHKKVVDAEVYPVDE